MVVLHGLGWFFSGVFLVNVLPHLIRGVSGDRFPSPFGKPHGKKLTSPTQNVIWAFLNLSVFLTIWYFNRGTFNELFGLIMFAGAFGMALYLAQYFSAKDKE